MADWINTIAGFRDAVGGAVNGSFTFSLVAPYLPSVAAQYTRPLLGAALEEALLRDNDEALDLARTFVRQAVAHFALADYAEVGAVQMTGAGITRHESDTQRSAFRYQEERYRRSVRARAFGSLERAILAVDDYCAAAPDAHLVRVAYEASQAYRQLRGKTVGHAAALAHYHGSEVDRQTYRAVRPILLDLERDGVRALMGRDTYAQLVQRLLTYQLPARPTHDEADPWGLLLHLVRGAVATAGIGEAQRRHLVQLDGGRVVARQQDSSQADYATPAPGADLLGLTQDYIRDFKARRLRAVRDHLDMHRDVFVAYAIEFPFDADADRPVGPATDYGPIVAL